MAPGSTSALGPGRTAPSGSGSHAIFSGLGSGGALGNQRAALRTLYPIFFTSRLFGMAPFR